MQGLDSLNDKQKEAVFSDKKQLLILAGAGTGKTSTLTYKIAHLIKDKGINPYNILAITFTNKAANEMRERIKSVVGDDSDDMWVLTFHGACLRILKRFIDRLGYKNSFIIYDTDDKMSLINRIMKDRNIGGTLNKKVVASEISNAKLLGMEPIDYANSIDGYEINKKNIASIYEIYQQELKDANALDFDDLIRLTVKLFDDHEDVRDYYSNRFEHIFVDEYQDTNKQQFKLVEQLARNHKNLCVVGDDDQSIYKFRGANVGNILDFERVYKNAGVIKLEQNYRSTKKILEAANSVIANNKNRKDKRLWTENKEGEDVIIYDFKDERDEAKAITSKIKLLYSLDKYKYNDIAILYRTNSLSRVFEEYMVKDSIPYKIIGGINFYQRKEVKDIIAYLKVLVNPYDSTSLRRIINVPKRGIGDATIQKLADYSLYNNVSLYDAMLMADSIGSLTSGTVKKINDFTKLIEDFKKQLDIYSLNTVIDNIVQDTGYFMDFTNPDEKIERENNIKELISKAEDYNVDSSEDIAEDERPIIRFLQEISLYTDLDSDEKNEDKVTLMTVHSAKGLEYPCVFLVGMEEDLFPFFLAVQEGDIDEERRLCYVAITRAKEMLNISWANRRRGKFSGKSIFLREINEKYLNKNRISSSDIKLNLKKDYMKFNRQTKSNIDDFKTKKVENVDFSIGDRVLHRKFGEGVVMDIYKNEDLYIKVNFDKSGIKDMSATYANLKKIN